MIFPKIAVHAASVGAIDFTAAAHWASIGAQVSVFVNTEKAATSNARNASFDSIAGLPIGRLSRSPDGRFRTLYSTFENFGIEGIIFDVAAELSKILPEATSLLTSRAKSLAEKAAALPHHLDWRVRILSSVYPLLGLDVRVSDLRSLILQRDGQWLEARFNSLRMQMGQGYEPFIRGGRIERFSAGETSTYGGCARDQNGRVSASLGPNLTVSALDLVTWNSGSIRLRGSLDLLYGVDTESAAGHLPWHSHATSAIEPAPVYEIVSPPCRVMQGVRRLTPSGYSLLDYGGLAQEYARRLIGAGFWSQVFDLFIGDTEPIREKYSQSQRSARRIALRVLSDNIMGSPLSECALVWHRCRGLLACEAEPPAEELLRLAGSVAKVGGVVEAMLSSVNLADYAINDVKFVTFWNSLQKVESQDAWRFRVNDLRRACEQICELSIGGSMLVYEAILRADIIRIYLLCGSSAVFSDLLEQRKGEKFLAWEPIVVRKDNVS